ncbi:MAG: hypothetical protein IH597_02905 [Bacteroidales bacterium]|nr:hypothetical protein [Bacteroidales bacterium]
MEKMQFVEAIGISKADFIIPEVSTAQTQAAQSIGMWSQIENKIVPLEKKSIARGIFIYTVNDQSVQLDKLYNAGILSFLRSRGFCKRYIDDCTYLLIRQEENKIYEVEIANIRDEINIYLKSLSRGIVFEYAGKTVRVSYENMEELFLRQIHLILNYSTLGFLENHDTPILADTKTEMFFPFRNCVVKVIQGREGIVPMNYSELDNLCIWKNQIIDHDYSLDSNDPIFKSFVGNVANDASDDPGQPRFKGFKSAIGYLLHYYQHNSLGRAVVAYDAELTERDRPQGGTGKGIIAQAIRQLRNSATIDGKKFNPAQRFCFQGVDKETQVIYLDDVKPDFDFLRFNSVLTEGIEVEQKYKASYKIEIDISPKIYITSNVILNAEGNTAQRRMYILEFSSFYSDKQRSDPMKNPIDTVHGGIFFDKQVWNQTEWNRFFTFMFECCNFYLTNGLHPYGLRSVNQNRLIQFTSREFYDWILQSEIEPNLEYDQAELFDEFKSQFYSGEDELFSQTFSKWLKIFAETNGLVKSGRKSSGKIFIKFTPSRQ